MVLAALRRLYAGYQMMIEAACFDRRVLNVRTARGAGALHASASFGLCADGTVSADWRTRTPSTATWLILPVVICLS